MNTRLGKIQFKLTRLRLWGGLLLLLYFAHVLQPLYWLRPGADDCTFGPVTNAEYRALRNAASKEFWLDRIWLPWSDDERAKRIEEMIETISKNSSSFYVRMAATHAVMKSINGDHFISTNTQKTNNINRDYDKNYEEDNGIYI